MTNFKMMPLARETPEGKRYYCPRCSVKKFMSHVHTIDGPACATNVQRRANAMLAAAPFIPSWDMAETDKRLMLLAAHLEHANERHAAARKPLYDQRRAMHNCGTPACAGGHSDVMYERTRYALSSWAFLYGVQIHYSEWDHLFGDSVNVRDAKHAAERIRAFALERHARRMRQAAV